MIVQELAHAETEVIGRHHCDMKGRQERNSTRTTRCGEHDQRTCLGDGAIAPSQTDLGKCLLRPWRVSERGIAEEVAEAVGQLRGVPAEHTQSVRQPSYALADISGGQLHEALDPERRGFFVKSQETFRW
jgi:hypothetical protein